MWIIKNLEYRKIDGVVTAIVAEYKGYEIVVDLLEPTGDLIPFSDLTEAQVLDWLHNNYDTLSLENKINSLPIEESEIDLGTPW